MTNEELSRADEAVVSGTHLRSLRAVMNRTDTGAFRDAQNLVALMIEQGCLAPDPCYGPQSASCPLNPQ
jgi:hypothetical protein